MFQSEQKMIQNPRLTKSLLDEFFVAFHVHMWPCYGLVWPYYGLVCPKYRFEWTCIVFSRGHRSKFIWSCFELFEVVMDILTNGHEGFLYLNKGSPTFLSIKL